MNSITFGTFLQAVHHHIILQFMMSRFSSVNHITGKAAAFNGAADLCFFAAIDNENALKNALKNRLLRKQGDFDDAVGGLGVLLLLCPDFGENQRMEDVFELGFGFGGLENELAQSIALEAT